MFSKQELYDAWKQVRSGGPSPGVDGVAQEAFAADADAQLEALLADFTSGTYAPQACRTVGVLKPAGGIRRLVIPTVRDRVAQTAALNRITPVLEPLLHSCCFSYRRGIGVQDALEAVISARDANWRWGIRADIARFFDSIPHNPLFDMLATVGVDPPMLSLLRAWLRTPQETPDGLVIPERGLPQGLPISPLLSNVYLIPFDEEMTRCQWRLVRYADDMVLFMPSSEWVEDCKREIEQCLSQLELALATEKTARVTFDEGFEFLGARFHGNEMFPAQPHPYERDQTPPRRENRPPAQTLPHVHLRTLYIQEQGAYLRLRKARFAVSRERDTLLDVHARHVDQIYIFGRVTLSPQATAFCLEHEIPVFMFSSHGSYYGVLQSVDDAPVALRRAQFALADRPEARLEFSRVIVRHRVHTARNLLLRQLRNHPDTDLEAVVTRMKEARDRALGAVSIDQLRGIEGSAAAAFFQGFGRCLRGSLTFTHRVRRPPTDPVNSLLSFGYTLVFYNVYAYLRARRLDPAVGMYHEERAGHPALASDLVEELRAPIVENLLLSIVNRSQLGPEDFVYGEPSSPDGPRPCRLADDARVRFFRAYEERMASTMNHPDSSTPVNWRRVIDLQALRMRRWIEGAVSMYQPFDGESAQ